MSRALFLHPRRLSVHVYRPAVDHAPVRGLRIGRRIERPLRQLLAAGTTGLSVAFDLPTQMGYDSDDPMAAGEVGKVGVAIDSIDDMRTLFDQIPLDQVSTSMTINSPAALVVAHVPDGRRRERHRAFGAAWHCAERHPQGVHRARHLHLPPTGIAAVCDRSLRLLQDRAAGLEHDLCLRLPHGRGRRDARPRGRVYFGRCDRVRQSGAGGRAQCR